MKEFDTDRVDSTEHRDRMTEEFHALYDAEPQTAVRAPGRVDLTGSHTDYNEGFVMTLPINRETSNSLKFQSLSRRRQSMRDDHGFSYREASLRCGVPPYNRPALISTLATKEPTAGPE